MLENKEALLLLKPEFGQQKIDYPKESIVYHGNYFSALV
jgi:hypothetical protein